MYGSSLCWMLVCHIVCTIYSENRRINRIILLLEVGRIKGEDVIVRGCLMTSCLVIIQGVRIAELEVLFTLEE